MGERKLPAELTGRPFTVREAREAGVRECDVRALGLHRPTRGVRTSEVPTTARGWAVAFHAVMPQDAAFSHVTAAQLLRLPLPPGLERQTLLDVMCPTAMTQVRRRGCAGHRGLESRAITDVGGLRCVGLADTWCDLGEVVARGLTTDDVIVVADAVASRLDDDGDLGPPVPGAPGQKGTARASRGLSLLRDTLAARVRPRSMVVLSEALDLARSGSRSPMETRARLMFHRAGFPEPELNAVVRDGDGGWLLCGDLVWRAQRVIGEYQGVDHASIARRSADASRAGGAEDHGWRVIEIFAGDVLAGARRRTCLRRFARALGLDPTQLRID